MASFFKWKAISMQDIRPYSWVGHGWRKFWNLTFSNTPEWLNFTVFCYNRTFTMVEEIFEIWLCQTDAFTMVEENFEILLSETLQNDLVLLFLSKWCLRHGWKQFLAYLTATLTDGQQTTTWTESINVLHWSDMEMEIEWKYWKYISSLLRIYQKWMILFILYSIRSDG